MSDDRIYPCDDCGAMRTKAEGGTVFTVCDKCWDKHHPKPAPVEAEIESTDGKDMSMKSEKIDISPEALEGKRIQRALELLEATERLAEWMESHQLEDIVITLDYTCKDERFLCYNDKHDLGSDWGPTLIDAIIYVGKETKLQARG